MHADSNQGGGKAKRLPLWYEEIFLLPQPFACLEAPNLENIFGPGSKPAATFAGASRIPGGPEF